LFVTRNYYAEQLLLLVNKVALVENYSVSP